MKKVKIEQAENGFVIFLLDGSYSERPVKSWVAYNLDELEETLSGIFGKVKKQPPDLTAGEFNRREC